jgi:hypothetical protein
MRSGARRKSGIAGVWLPPLSGASAAVGRLTIGLQLTKPHKAASRNSGSGDPLQAWTPAPHCGSAANGWGKRRPGRPPQAESLPHR